jgi:molecular chaperone HtpG
MCIRWRDHELLPEWAPFVRGVVDCPDLQPTAARDNVLRDSVYHALREALGKTIVAALLDLAVRDRPRFLQLCDWHQDALKGMAARHEEFGAAVLDYLPFATNQGELTLPDYLTRQSPGTNGKRPLYFFSHEADANQFYPLCRARGVLGINAGGAFDETLLRRYAGQHPEQVDLKPLDRLDDSALYPLLDAAAQVRYAPLLRAVDRALAEADAPVRTQIRQFQPADLSAVVLSGQRLTAFDQMEQMLEKSLLANELAELAGEVRDRLRRQPLDLLLNAAHPLVQRLGELADPDHPRYRPVLTGLYYSALLNARHRLTPAAARHFHADLQALLASHLDLQIRHDA